MTAAVRTGSLAGRVVVVTGAAHAGTTDLVRSLSAVEAKVALCATFEMRARARRARAQGSDVIAVAVRWRDPASIDAALVRITRELGRIDSIVHIAAEERDLTPASDRVAAAAVEAGGLAGGVVVYAGSGLPAPGADLDGLPYAVVTIPYEPSDRRSLKEAADQATAACARRLTSPDVD